jgi:hypothetical protein
MHCQRCDAPAYPGQTVCYSCGAPLRREQSSPELAHPASGVPVEPYEASAYGPPAAMEVPPGALEDARPVRRVVGYQPVTLPPPPRSGTSCRSGCVRIVLLTLLVVACGIALVLIWPRLPLPHAGSILPGQSAFAGIALPVSWGYWFMRKERVRSPVGSARDLTNG